MMTPNKAAGINGTASFATARRGGLSAMELAQARKTLGARATPAQIAKITGRCELDVREAMEQVATPSRSARADEEQGRVLAEQKRQEAAAAATERLFRRLWAEDVAMREIGRRLGVSENTVRKWARARGFPPRRPGRRTSLTWTPECDKLIRDLFIGQRMSATVVAKQIPGATRMSVLGRAHRLGYSRDGQQQVAA